MRVSTNSCAEPNLTTSSVTTQTVGSSWRLPRRVVWFAILSGLIFILFAPVLGRLVEHWWTDPDYGHGFFVPLFSGYVLWRERERWTKKQVKPSNSGLPVIVGSVALLLLGSLGAELFISRFSLLALFAGMILFLGGSGFLRAVSFPLAYLLFMIPLPVIVYNQITFPLQLLASRLAAFSLDLARVPVFRDGNLLMFSNYSLEVVEACSGIRSLMTLISLAVAYGYLAESRRWVRYLLVILMIPTAIISNALRIVGAGILAQRFGPNAADRFLHEFSGWVIFSASLLLMFLYQWILRQVGQKREKPAHA